MIDKSWTYGDLAKAVGSKEPTVRTFMSLSAKRDMPKLEGKIKKVLKLD